MGKTLAKLFVGLLFTLGALGTIGQVAGAFYGVTEATIGAFAAAIAQVVASTITWQVITGKPHGKFKYFISWLLPLFMLIGGGILLLFSLANITLPVGMALTLVGALVFIASVFTLREVYRRGVAKNSTVTA